MTIVLRNSTLAGNTATNGDAAIDASDLAVWQQNHGATTPALGNQYPGGISLAVGDMDGNHGGHAEIHFVEVSGGDAPAAHPSGINTVLMDGSVRGVSPQDGGVSFFAYEAGFRGGVDVATSASDGFVVTFDRPVDPSNVDVNIGVGELQECTISKSMDTAGAIDRVDADALIFQTSAPPAAEELEGYMEMTLSNAMISSWSASSSAAGGYDDGKVDAADYVVWRKNGSPDTVDADLTLSTVDAGGIPATMAEYGLLLA